MLWLSLSFPYLALNHAQRGFADDTALAIVDTQQSGSRILQCSTPAQRLGVRAGMSLANALAIAPQLYYCTNPADKQQAALHYLATWAGRFSSYISLEPPHTILLEIGASLRLFKGLETFCKRLNDELSELAYQALFAIAPLPAAASAFTRAGTNTQITSIKNLPYALDKLPVSALALADDIQQNLQDIGVRYLGELNKLPQAGLRKRFGAQLPTQLGRLYGSTPDPRVRYRPPETFYSALELPYPVDQASMLLFACKRLLQELTGFLRARQRAIQTFQLRLRHHKNKTTRLDIGLQRPSCNTEYWLHLLQERLHNLELNAPVDTIALCARQFVADPVTSVDLLERCARTRQTMDQLVERLSNRLGNTATATIGSLETAADHRPERAWRLTTPGHSGTALLQTPRPLWLLPEAVSLAAPPASTWSLRGPERIESGWWDGADISRDYYIATAPTGQHLWIYQQRRGERGWFLQGIFA